MKNKLLIATGNQGKFAEFQKIFAKYNLDYELISTKKFNFDEPVENGKDFAENALIKARYYGEKTKLISLADDSGLCIDLLSGAPGIFSARWAIDNNGKKDFKFAFKQIRDSLEEKGINLANTEIKAYFFCSLVLFNPQNKKYDICNGQCFGKLDFSNLGHKNGFGYDPIFIADGYKKNFSEISEEEKNLISHRGLAANKMVAYF
jgi:XTP/dITP diphosphohydrolase